MKLRSVTWLTTFVFGCSVWNACGGLPPEKSNVGGNAGQDGKAPNAGAGGSSGRGSSNGGDAGASDEANAGSRDNPSAGASGEGGSDGDGGSDASGGTQSSNAGGAGVGSAGKTASGGSDASGGAVASGGSGGASVTPGRICPPESLFEPNDSAGNPCWIQPNKLIDSALNGDDKDDFFSIDLVKNTTYTLDITSTSSINRGLTLRVDNKDDELIPYGYQSGGTKHTEFTPKASGRAIFRLNGSAQYHFVIWESSVGHDANFEPNNSPSLAAALQIGQAVDTALTSAEDDFDYYRFDVVAGQTYTFEFTHPKSLYRGISQLVDGQSYDLIDYGFQSAGASHDEFIAHGTGKAVLVLNGLGSYQARILGANPAHDPVTYEPNNSPSTAASVALGSSITSELGAPAEDNEDYYQFPVKANTKYIVHLERAKSMYVGVNMAGLSSTLSPYGFMSAGSSDITTSIAAPADGFAILRLSGSTTYKFSVAAVSP